MSQAHQLISPFTFEVYNTEGQSRLYIAENDQDLTLEVTNGGTRPIVFLWSTDDSNKAFYHLKLSLQADTLDPVCLKSGTLALSSASEAEWEMLEPDQDDQGVVTLFFRRRLTDQKSGPFLWQPQEKLTITLVQAGASEEKGSRQVLVALSAANIQFPDDELDLTFIRHTHLNLINRRGLKSLPIQARLMGDPMIFSDAKSTNHLTIRFSNKTDFDPVNPKRNTVLFEQGSRDKSGSRIIIQIPVGSSEDPLSVLSHEAFEALKVEAPEHWKSTKDKGCIVLSPLQNVSLPEPDNPEGTPGFFDLRISNIPGRQKVGRVSILITYQNIPGYWDGNRELKLELRPIQFLEQDSTSLTYSTGKMGIGTKEPTGLLEIDQTSFDSEQQALTLLGNSQEALAVIENSGTGKALQIQQKGAGPSAYFQGGKVQIEQISGKQNAFYIEASTDYSSTYLENTGKGNVIRVTQKGTGPCALFEGGKVFIDQMKHAEGALHVRSSASKPMTVLENKGLGKTLSVVQRGKGACASFEGGAVGIGIKEPGKGALEIASHQAFDIRSGYGYLNREGKTNKYEKKQRPQRYSLFAHQRIAASEFNAHSDARIKQINGTSHALDDLQTLLKIQITDYHFKDQVEHGDSPQKKVLGQQVATVFPQAVGKQVQVIPETMQTLLANEGRIILPGNSFKEGDRLKLIFSDDTSGLYDVLKSDVESIQLDTSINGEVFIYGREVDDFHVVDYDAISMLNVSATQALHAKVEQQEKTIQAQEARIKSLEETVQRLLAKMEQTAS